MYPKMVYIDGTTFWFFIWLYFYSILNILKNVFKWFVYWLNKFFSSWFDRQNWVYMFIFFFITGYDHYAFKMSLEWQRASIIIVNWLLKYRYNNTLKFSNFIKKKNTLINATMQNPKCHKSIFLKKIYTCVGCF